MKCNKQANLDKEHKPTIHTRTMQLIFRAEKMCEYWTSLNVYYIKWIKPVIWLRDICAYKGRGDKGEQQQQQLAT